MMECSWVADANRMHSEINEGGMEKRMREVFGYGLSF